MNCFNYKSRSALGTTYDNSVSGLTAENVQNAIDEIASSGGSSITVNTYADLPSASDNSGKLAVVLTDQGSWVNRMLGTFYSKGWYYSTGTDWVYKGDWTLNDEADEIAYDNTTSGLTATEVQSAIDEIAASSGGGGYSSISATANFNTLLTDGSYITSGTTYTNSPLYDLETTGILRVCRSSPTAVYIHQEWWDCIKGVKWERYSQNSGTNWTMWKSEKDYSEPRGVQQTFNMDNAVSHNTLTSDGMIQSGLRVDVTGGAAFATGGSAYNTDTLRKFIKFGTQSSSTAVVYIAPFEFQGALNFFGKKGFYRIEALISLDENVSDSTDGYKVIINSLDRTTSSVKCLTYTHDENSGNWTAVTDASGTETTTDTGIAPAHGVLSSDVTSYQKLRIEWDITNATVYFFINDVIVATHTTNINQYTRFEIALRKTAGTNARYLAIGETVYNWMMESV